jgi:selenocysteine lyase/cysteine desulfurase
MIPCQRHLFNIPRDVAYLNCAYISPIPNISRDAGQAGLARKSSPWKIAAEDFFSESEIVRSMFANLIGAPPDCVAIVPSASYGVSIAATNVTFKHGQKVILLHEQFPSNVYPWRQLSTDNDGSVIEVSRPSNGDWATAIIDSMDSNTAVVAVPHCHWTDGGLVNLERVSEACRNHDAALIIDATQSLGALPLDISRVQPDFLVSASYKWLLGPYSLGFVYVAPKYHGGRPLEQTWISREGSQDFTDLVNYRDTFQPGARRYDMGERSNFALIPAARASLQLISDWGIERIAATLSAMTSEIASRARILGLTNQPDHLRAGHFLGIRFPNVMPANLVERLSEAGVHVSVRGTSMRVTPHLYNDNQDVDRLFEVLESIL